jgi:hypothetical protein
VAERPVALPPREGSAAMPPIRLYLDGRRFDAETTRIMGVAFETARIALRLTDQDKFSEAKIVERIIELAKAGERDPDLLCERVLFEFGKPGLLKSPASE